MWGSLAYGGREKKTAVLSCYCAKIRDCRSDRNSSDACFFFLLWTVTRPLAALILPTLCDSGADYTLEVEHCLFPTWWAKLTDSSESRSPHFNFAFTGWKHEADTQHKRPSSSTFWFIMQLYLICNTADRSRCFNFILTWCIEKRQNSEFNTLCVSAVRAPVVFRKSYRTCIVMFAVRTVTLPVCRDTLKDQGFVVLLLSCCFCAPLIVCFPFKFQNMIYFVLSQLGSHKTLINQRQLRLPLHNPAIQKRKKKFAENYRILHPHHAE